MTGFGEEVHNSQDAVITIRDGEVSNALCVSIPRCDQEMARGWSLPDGRWQGVFEMTQSLHLLMNLLMSFANRNDLVTVRGFDWPQGDQCPLKYVKLGLNWDTGTWEHIEDHEGSQGKRFWKAMDSSPFYWMGLAITLGGRIVSGSSEELLEECLQPRNSTPQGQAWWQVVLDSWCHSFCPPGLTFGRRWRMDGILGPSPAAWDSTGLTPVVEASTSTAKWMHWWSATVLKACFSFSKASVASGDQDRDLGLLWSREVSGLVMELKLKMKWQKKLVDPSKH